MKWERLAIWRASGQHAYQFKQLPVLAFLFCTGPEEAIWLN